MDDEFDYFRPPRAYLFTCKHNLEVICEDQDNCSKCGWNPTVDLLRKIKTRQKRERMMRICSTQKSQ